MTDTISCLPYPKILKKERKKDAWSDELALICHLKNMHTNHTKIQYQPSVEAGLGGYDYQLILTALIIT